MRPKQLLFEIVPLFYYGQNYIDNFQLMKSIHERLYNDSDISLSDVRISIKFQLLVNC